MDNDQVVLFMLIYCIIDAIGFTALIWGMSYFKKRVNDFLPENLTPGAVLADAVIQFMDTVRKDDQKAKLVVEFCGGLASASFDYIKPKIPLIGNATQLDENLERIAKRNPWAGLILSGLQVAAPLIQKQIAEQGGPQKPGKPGTGGRQYG